MWSSDWNVEAHRADLNDGAEGQRDRAMGNVMAVCRLMDQDLMLQGWEPCLLPAADAYLAVPPDAGSMPVSILMVVVLPAPLCPNSAEIWPS